MHELLAKVPVHFVTIVLIFRSARGWNNISMYGDSQEPATLWTNLRGYVATQLILASEALAKAARQSFGFRCAFGTDFVQDNRFYRD